MNTAEFTELFTTARSSLFRLEARSTYSIPEEADRISRFLAGDPLPAEPDPGLAEWLALVASAVKDGKQVRRVRAILGELTPYLRYELEWCYPLSDRAGEEIRILTDAASVSSEDFWLFDDDIAVGMVYDVASCFQSAEQFDAARTEAFCRGRDRMWESSMDLRTFLSHTRRSP